MKIKQLKESIFLDTNNIVRDIPSVIRELIENSIDASATEITITIPEDYSSVTVADNGCGIEAEDVDLLIKSNCTSKLDRSDKLLGFRGLSLFCIGEFASMDITTKISTMKPIVFKYYKGLRNTIKDIVTDEIKYDSGTTIKVYGFYEIDTTSQTLINDIVKIVGNIILSKPNITFSLTIGNYNLHHKASEMLDAVGDVWGEKAKNDCFYATWYYTGITVEGCFGKPNCSIDTKVLQTTSINGRVSVNAVVQSAIENIYNHYYMISRFPIYSLNITIPYKDVNFNLVGDKSQIEFSDDDYVYKAVRACVSKCLQYYYLHQKLNQRVDYVACYINKHYQLYTNSLKKSKIATLPKIKGYDGQTFYDNGGDILEHTSNSWFLRDHTIFELNEALSDLYKRETCKKSYYTYANAKVLGMVFDRFILMQRDDFFYCLDYIGMRAKYYFDTYLLSFEKNIIATTTMVEPYVFRLDKVDMHNLDFRMPLLAKLGFVFAPLTDYYYRLNKIPDIFAGSLDYKKFVTELLVLLQRREELNDEEFANFIDALACKHLQICTQNITLSELKSFVKNLDRDKLTISYDGKPLIVVLTIFDFQRKFLGDKCL
ncbi:MAG: DNA mismatch repair endonuclease MutL [Clostridia bacterium]